MNYSDIISILIIAIAAFIGYKKAFIVTALGIVSWMGSIIIALLIYRNAAIIIKQNFLVEAIWLYPLAFVIVFICSFFLLHLSIHFLCKIFPFHFHQSLLNKLLGVIPGILNGLAIAFIATKILSASIWFKENNKAGLTNGLFIAVLPSFDENIQQIFHVPVQEKISDAYEAAPGLNLSEEFRCTHFVAKAELENELLNLVNHERKQNGLQPFSTDKSLAYAATQHASDMFERGYFSHDTPEGMNPFDRMKKFGITYITAGENLAHSSNLLSAHKGLMESSGHRANILNPSFNHIGIAVLDGGAKGLMIVQEFKN